MTPVHTPDELAELARLRALLADPQLPRAERVRLAIAYVSLAHRHTLDSLSRR